MELEFTPKTWCSITGITVLDPDGWREDNKDWDEPIAFGEFQRRVNNSTAKYPPKFYDKKEQ